MNELFDGNPEAFARMESRAIHGLSKFILGSLYEMNQSKWIVRTDSYTISGSRTLSDFLEKSEEKCRESMSKSNMVAETAW
jgi:hypothetical protein